MCKCGDTGWIVATCKEKGTTFSFGCNSCGRSARYPHVPKWNDFMAAKYSTDFTVIIPDNKKKALAEKDDEDEVPW